MIFKQKLIRFWKVYKEGIVGGALVGVFVYFAYAWTGGTLDFAREAVVQSGLSRGLSAAQIQTWAKAHALIAFMIIGIIGGILIDHFWKPGK